jgi:ABC-type multidrug transport system fused ATPase/permease subunit
MMILRMAVRAPLMLVFSLGMAISLNARLAMIFLVAIPLLGAVLVFYHPDSLSAFQNLLKKYDRLNTMVQENLIAIRVVKSFVREPHESERFARIASQLRDIQRKAEKTVILNMPVMQFVMYGCMIAVAWFGGGLIHFRLHDNRPTDGISQLRYTDFGFSDDAVDDLCHDGALESFAGTYSGSSFGNPGHRRRKCR